MPGPSLRYTTVSVHGDMRDSRVEFILGRNTRYEYRNGPQRVIIENHDFHYSFHLDVEAGVYARIPLVDPWTLTGRKPMRRQPPQSGLILRVHTKTIDTGERREIFGYPGRRVLIRTTRTLEGDTDIDDTEIEGWYIDPPLAWRTLHPPGRRAILLTSINGRMPKPVFSEEGPPENGFPLLTTSTHHSRHMAPNGEIYRHTSVNRQEVTEISEAPLDPDLFAPPRHFRRVKRLPGERPAPLPMRLRLRWQRIKHALQLPI